MKSPRLSLIFTCLLLTISFCISAQIYNLSGTLSGANEVPPNPSMGTGSITGTYDQGTGMISIDVTYSGLTGLGTVSHIHGPAPAGVNAGVIIPLNLVPGSNSGSYLTTVAFPVMQEAALLAGNTYVNLHSDAYPGGELRSQISATLAPPIPTLQGWALIILAMAMIIIGAVVVRTRVIVA
ncbi:MAG: CHRD domain-containing protein [Saprospiraceae bacterium]|nr:CHRD domain-containing protein [Saprospiraceae bacterium]